LLDEQKVAPPTYPSLPPKTTTTKQQQQQQQQQQQTRFVFYVCDS
jgi:hypothetical protein